MSITGLDSRVRAYAALGDPLRLSIVDLLAHADRSPGELGARIGIPTNLMAHHLQVLQDAGLVIRRRSEGDGRRTYVSRTQFSFALIPIASTPRPTKVAFLCSQNSARSQLAESYWRSVSAVPVVSAGTHPARRVHPRAIATARKHGLDLSGARPKLAADVLDGGELVVAVCDRAYEENLGERELHWSVPDPARGADAAAFEAAYDDLSGRITRLAASIEGDRQ